MLKKQFKIVYITLDSPQTRYFGNELSKLFPDNLELIIVQKNKKQKKEPVWNRIKKMKRIILVIENGYYSLLLRLSKKMQHTLRLFWKSTHSEYSSPYRAPIMKVDSINDESVRTALTEIKPDLIVVCRSALLEKHIIQTATYVINLHYGLCPHYRGTISNQTAMYKNDPDHIGATIHFINSGVDSGNIIKTIPVIWKNSIEASFQHMNDTVFDVYLEVIQDFIQGVVPVGVAQNTKMGLTTFWSQWTPKMRYKTYQNMARWQKTLNN